MSKATLVKFLTMKRKVTAAKIHRTKKVVWVVCYKMKKASECWNWDILRTTGKYIGVRKHDKAKSSRQKVQAGFK